MADEYITKQFAGGAPATTITAGINASAVSITIADATGQPAGGASGKFVMVIDPNLATEEKILVTSRSGTTLTVSQRGYDGTTARSHSAGAVIVHCLDAYTVEQANRMANAATAQYDLVMRGAAGNAWSRIPVGANGHVMRVSGGAPGFGAITPDMLGALLDELCPAGSMKAYLGASEPDGWLFHNQAVANCNTTYPTLWSRAPASWKSGTTLTIPDLSDVVLAQTGGSAAALGATGGAMSVTLAEANLPAHNHAVTVNAEAAHTHGDGSLTAAAGGDHNHGGSTGSTQHRSAQGIAGGSGTGYVTSMSIFFALSPDNNEAHTHSIGNSGTHTHDVTGTTSAGSSHTHTASTANVGSGTAVTTRPKHLGVNIIIKAH